MTTTRATTVLSLTFAALLCGCGGDIGDRMAGPCDRQPPAPGCGESCVFDTGCDDGFHCGPAGACTAECTATGGECGSGYDCDPNGRCIASADPDGGFDGSDDECPRVAVNLTPEIPYVMLLIDRSGSMYEEFGNGLDRWEAVEQALVDPNDGVVAQLDDRVIFGAALYTSRDGDTTGNTCPLIEETAPAENNYENIRALIANNSPDDDTPTAEAVNVVTAGFPLPDPERPGPRILVLATDGNPDRCDDPNAHGDVSKANSEQAVQSAFANGIKTFVLSVGQDVALDHLERLANAGVGAPLDSNVGKPYVATDPGSLVAAFDEIIRGTRSCIFQLDGQVDSGRADDGTVVLDGVELEHGTDWRLIDGTTLELLGQACNTFLEQDEVGLEASFPCGVVIL